MSLKNILFKYLFASLLVALLFAEMVRAEDPVSTDSRIRTLVYSENEVFQLVTEHGYQSNIEFGAREKILTLSVGDSVSFKVTPSGNRLFVKSLQDNRHTNMTVLTNLHAYQFELSSIIEDEQDVIYVMRFYYPEDNFDSARPVQKVGIDIKEFASKQIIQENYNYNYSLTGPEHLSPVKIFDDGRATYLKFDNSNAVVPSLYVINPDGTETPLVTRRDGEYVVVEQVFSQMALRRGPDVVCVFNDSRSPIVPISDINVAQDFEPQPGKDGFLTKLKSLVVF